MNTECESCKCGSQDRLLNQDEVAERLAVSVRTLEHYRSKGSAGGPVFVKVGKLARYRESDVQAYIEQLTQG